MNFRYDSNDTINDTFRYLMQKPNMIDDWDIKLIKFQNDYNEMFHELINIIDRRLNQLKIFVSKINEKIDLLTRTQHRKSFNSQNWKLSLHEFHNFFSRKVTFDWSTFRSFQRLKTLSTKMSLLININIQKKIRKTNINFFDFTCFEMYDKNDYVIVSDKMHYRNVWLFFDSTNVIIIVKKIFLIRINFHRCFKNDV